MAFLGKRQLATLAFLTGLLVGCGGGGDGSSSSGNVSPTDNSTGTGTGNGTGNGTGTMTSSFNVSQVFTNGFTTAATYNLSGTAPDGGAVQMAFKMEPQVDVSYQGRMAKRVKIATSGTVNGVAVPSEDLVTRLFDINPFIWVADNWTETSPPASLPPKPSNGSTSSSTKFTSAPALVAIGTSGDLGQATETETSSNRTTTSVTTYRYSVEAGTSAGTAWVCEIDTLHENNVLDSETRMCFLSNASSQILGMKIEFKGFDAAGNVTTQMTLR